MKSPSPPILAQKLLQRFLRQDLAEEVLGDLEEKFEYTIKRKSPFRARLNYWYQVVNYLRPFALRKTRRMGNIRALLYLNLVLSLRNFKKHRSQFLINWFGLSSGLVCTLLIYLWVEDEYQIDSFHVNQERLFQVMSNHSDASGIHTWKGVPGLLLEDIQQLIPEVEKAVACTDAHEYTLSVNEAFIKANGKFASKDFVDVFTYPLVAGDGKSALSDKSSILLTESLARRLFNTTDVVGKSLTWHFWNTTRTVQISGILKDIPTNSSDQFDFVMSWEYYHDELVSYKNWYNYYARIMVVLNDARDQEEVGNKIATLLHERQHNESVELFLAKYSERYLFNKYENGVQMGGRIEYVYLFIVVAVFILLIACINFVNLSTARAYYRLKEIGVKKALGASRLSLMGQFFTESILLSLFSLSFSLFLVWLLLPHFNHITEKQLYLNLNPRMLVISLGLICCVGFIAGCYPALYLSGLKLLDVIKGRLPRVAHGAWGRRVLVVVQFSLSIILIVSVVVINQQIHYVKNKNLGYDRENVLYFEREGKVLQNSAAFVDEVKNIPGIAEATVSGFMVGGANSTSGVDWDGKQQEDEVSFWETKSGYGLIEMLGLELVDGRVFSKDFPSDSSAIIFNETAVRAMDMDEPIGQTVRHYSGDRKIIGVVKDFNLLSLHTQVEPMLFLLSPEETHYVMVKFDNHSSQSAIDQLEILYSNFNPGYVFKPQFLDQDYAVLYASEERVGILARYFAALAILISCLGLFGLAAFTTEQRTKEIGIRKILGSGVHDIIYMLTADFSRMVLVAVLIALPVSYMLISNWLNDFAFRIDLEWWVFIMTGFGAFVIAWCTVGFQTYRTARANPGQCLRDE